ncbi:AarF/UbiB family protein [Streptomyces sp. NPDC050147]|uniref:ABC1 kinase family protein n=1 Tax=Streptomyces sp. NPDC050147 TaxID=3155513 RepID=UPI003437DDC5
MWIIAGLTGTLAIVLLPAFLGRRLLGIKAGPLRIAVAGVVGISVSGSLLGPQLQNADRRHIMLSLMIGIGLLTAMVTLVSLRELLPAGSGPLDLVRGVRGRIARGRRYTHIAKIAGRHGLGPYLRGRRAVESAGAPHQLLAQELRQALQAGGVTFVKLGQLMSTRRDLLPQPYVEELSRLQDQVAPASWPQVEETLIAGLGMDPGQAFAEFDRLPLAAASIAQVHAAVLHDGTRVVVKIQRPGIQELVERDLDIVNRLAATLQSRTNWGRSLGLMELARGFAVALREELDFRIEARNMTAVRMAAQARGDWSVTVPQVYEQLSTARVLVMSRVDGVPLGQVAPGSAELGEKLAGTLLTALLNQIMQDGVFHADPHPGNIMVLPDGTPALLDFGSVGRIDTGLRASMAGLFLAVDRGDPTALCDALLEVTNRPEQVDEQRLRRALGHFSARYLVHGGAQDAAMFTELFRLMTDFRLAVPPEIAAVFRALATMEGTLTRLSDGFDIVEASRAYAATQFARQLSPGTAGETAREELVALLPVLRRLPRRLDRISGALEEGRLGVNVRLLADPRDRRVIGELLSRVLLAFLAVFFGIAGVLLLLGSKGGPEVATGLGLYALIGYHLLLLSGVLVLRTVYTLARPPA